MIQERKGKKNDDGKERVAIAESVSSADERGGNLCQMEKHGYIIHVQRSASLEADLMISLT